MEQTIRSTEIQPQKLWIYQYIVINQFVCFVSLILCLLPCSPLLFYIFVLYFVATYAVIMHSVAVDTLLTACLDDTLVVWGLNNMSIYQAGTLHRTRYPLLVCDVSVFWILTYYSDRFRMSWPPTNLLTSWFWPFFKDSSGVHLQIWVSL